MKLNTEKFINFCVNSHAWFPCSVRPRLKISRRGQLPTKNYNEVYEVVKSQPKANNQI